MGEYKENNNRQSRVIDNPTTKPTQPPLSEILQFRKERYWNNSITEQDTALAQHSKNIPIQYKSDRTIQRCVFIGASREELTLSEVINKYFPKAGPDIMKILEAYDSLNYHFQTEQDLIDTINGQLVFTHQYWKSAVDPKEYPKTQSSKYWDSYKAESSRPTTASSASPSLPAKKGKASKKPKETKRTLAEIISTIAPALLHTLDTLPTTSPRSKLYKSLPRVDADAIIAWAGDGKAVAENMARAETKPIESDISKTLKDKRSPSKIIPIGGHIGDLVQTLQYRTEGNVTIEITLKPGALALMFDPQYMALGYSGEVPPMIAERGKKQHAGRYFLEASAGEGNLPGYIGAKSEQRGPFSLTMGANEVTPALFQMFVESVKILEDGRTAFMAQQSGTSPSSQPGASPFSIMPPVDSDAKKDNFDQEPTSLSKKEETKKLIREEEEVEEFSSQQSKIINIDTWEIARQMEFNKGDLIRITKHTPNISDRVFEFLIDYFPDYGSQLRSDREIKWRTDL